MNTSSPPKTDKTVIIQYKTRGYSTKTHRYEITGEKWEECRWVNREKETGSKPHWEPWCGNDRINTTHHIPEEDVLSWIETP